VTARLDKIKGKKKQKNNWGGREGTGSLLTAIEEKGRSDREGSEKEEG